MGKEVYIITTRMPVYIIENEPAINKVVAASVVFEDTKGMIKCMFDSENFVSINKNNVLGISKINSNE